MIVTKRMAIHGLNVAMAVFIGLSAYGILLYYDGGWQVAGATSLLTTSAYFAGIVASIAGISYFGIQLDRRKAEERREEEVRKAAEAARKGRRKPVKGSRAADSR